MKYLDKTGLTKLVGDLKNIFQPKGSYLTSIPSEYITETELNAKGYAKQSSVDELSEEIVDLKVFATPQMYGAYGDGVHDDTQAFKDAIAENDNVFVPSGNYLITDTLDISYKKSLYSDDGQRATLLYNGSNSVVSIGRMSVFRNINITIKNAFSGIIFDTNNYNKNSGECALESRVEHVNVIFNIPSPNATLIGITMDSGTDANNIPKLTGVCFQTYNDIVVDNPSSAYGYGIKMELIQGRPFTEATKTGFPWITHINYNDIYLGRPHTAIKSTVTNTSGSEHFERINVGHILFDNVYTQWRDAESTQFFLDLDNIGAYFSKCIGWDYHSLTWDGKKVNIIGENVKASFINCNMDFGSDFLQTCDFIAETEFNVIDNPVYFMDKYFKGTILNNGYDSINAKIDEKLNDEYVANIVEEKVNDILYSGYTNILDDPLSKILTKKRWSNSGQEWVDTDETTTIVIPLVKGGNVIRWSPSTYLLDDYYAYLYFFNEDELTTSIIGDSYVNMGFSRDGGYIEVDNAKGYKYVAIPFDPYTDISSSTMIMTINREITGDEGKSYTEYLKESVITPTIEEKFAKTETWTFTLEDGSTVTKKVVLA